VIECTSETAGDDKSKNGPFRKLMLILPLQSP
jgi:hypothetical protein